MNTPLVDFVKEYKQRHTARFHMPGHKGHPFLGAEPDDITEIKGADVLYHGSGIISESEHNASGLFGSGASHYSVCGSTSCIKAMLAVIQMEERGRHGDGRPYILAARNVHRSMIDACAILDIDVEFIEPSEYKNICSSVITVETVKKRLSEKKRLPLGVYVTSPDYLGQMTDIGELAKLCRSFGTPLLVDNAHGAYLHFLEEPQHPLDLGAAMCCDSAHKTLPALTGAAYLHIHKDYRQRFEPYAAQALALFSTTSPSYLILQSLDWCNAYLAGDYRQKLQKLTKRIAEIKRTLRSRGLFLWDSEPLKIVINAAQSGYTGEETADEMRTFQIECEYADWQNVVLMATVENAKQDWERLEEWSRQTRLVQKPRTPVAEKRGHFCKTRQMLTVREAVFAPSEKIPVTEALHRICAAQTVACPPAIPIAVSGEEITEEMIKEFQKYGIYSICVVRE